MRHMKATEGVLRGADTMAADPLPVRLARCPYTAAASAAADARGTGA